jgi:hypothetical protein
MHVFDRDEVTAQIRERADSDPAFRARLLADPSAAVSEILGMSVPQAVQFTVHEESVTDIHLGLKASPDFSEADLDLVSGGSWGYATCTSGSCGSCE